MGKLTIAGPRLKPARSHRISLPEQTGGDATPYQSEEHKRWRVAVMQRAGWRCQHVEKGIRCSKSAPESRLFADHIVEIKDAGQRFDPSNGQALCGAHHTLKTGAQRGVRVRRDWK